MLNNGVAEGFVTCEKPAVGSLSFNHLVRMEELCWICLFIEFSIGHL